MCWQYTLKEAILSQPFIYNNLIYLGSSNGDILCFTLDGKLIKNIKFNECFFYKPILHNNNKYFFSFTGRIISLTLSLDINWELNCDELLIKLGIYNNNIYSLDNQGHFYFVDSKTGELLNKVRIIENSIFSIPVKDNKNLLIKDRLGNLIFYSIDKIINYRNN